MSDIHPENPGHGGATGMTKAGFAPLGAGERSGTPGASLEASRLEKGWSVEQVAAMLKMSPRQIRAIEADDHAALPGPAVTRGFVRTYAKLLQLDAGPLLAAMAGSAPAETLSAPTSLSTPFVAKRSGLSRNNLSSGERHPKGRWLAAVLLAGVAGGAVFALNSPGRIDEWRDALSARIRLASEAGQAEKAVSPGSSAAGDAAANPASVVVQAAPVSAALEAGTVEKVAQTMPERAPEAVEQKDAVPPAAAAPDAPAPMDVAEARAQAAEPVSPAAAKKTDDLLQLVMREDSWLEVRRVADHAVLAARLVKAGTTETFEVDGPLAVTVGNAAGVDATLHGKPLALAAATGGKNVARLTVK